MQIETIDLEFQGTPRVIASFLIHGPRGPVLVETGPRVEIYDRRRREAGVLNYQDLLMRAASLLRERTYVREYFRKRLTHLLVDEFQDTDPIQAEVMLLLTADDVAQRDWRACKPVPGSLFVVEYDEQVWPWPILWSVSRRYRGTHNGRCCPIRASDRSVLERRASRAATNPCCCRRSRSACAFFAAVLGCRNREFESIRRRLA